MFSRHFDNTKRCCSAYASVGVYIYIHLVFRCTWVGTFFIQSNFRLSRGVEKFTEVTAVAGIKGWKKRASCSGRSFSTRGAACSDSTRVRLLFSLMRLCIHTHTHIYVCVLLEKKE
jgi:hypothetical protein